MVAPAETILILGGTREAYDVAARLHADGTSRVITSLAGRTAAPLVPAGELRIGGFGGVDGLVCFLRAETVSRVIDATHPFAHQISQNARLACRQLALPLEVVERPAWTRRDGDHWTEVDDLETAARILPDNARVFLALGRQYLSAFTARPDCRFVIRMVDPPEVPLPFASHDLVLGKASADAETEAELLRKHAITHLVARNSGGNAGYGKILAARQLGIAVILLKRAS